MFSLINPRARSSGNGTELLSTGQVATQPASLSTGDESNEVAERAATYEELLPYLMLAMAAAI
ncbi:hypothetical protein PQR34_07145 [Paraburkholderia sediminicola]|jgi:hypothetical protein|uniref:hypothetical protein n=1 Tax=Paraburkholderia sediminicola TaxID=458836 RepID=UPI0038BD86B1